MSEPSEYIETGPDALEVQVNANHALIGHLIGISRHSAELDNRDQTNKQDVLQAFYRACQLTAKEIGAPFAPPSQS